MPLMSDPISSGCTMPAFLNSQDWRPALEFLGFDRQSHAEALSAASALSQSPILMQRLEVLHTELCMQSFTAENWRNPEPSATLAERYLHLFPLLRRMNWLKERYAERGISETVLRETLSDVWRWMHAFRERNGVTAVAEPGWLRLHFSAKVFSLGRLQFEPTVLKDPMEVWRHKSGIRTILVSAARIADNGFFADSEGCGGIPARDLRIEKDARGIYGHPVLPSGRVSPTAVRLKHDAWSRLLGPDDPVAGIHIPAGSPLDHSSCTASFEAAASFFPRHFPELPIQAAICHSWLCNPDLASILPADANIVRFQTRFRLYPVPAANADQTYERVFPIHRRALAPDEIRSSLQRALATYIRNGGIPLLGGGMIAGTPPEWRSPPHMLAPTDLPDCVPAP